MNRRDFLKKVGLGAAALLAVAVNKLSIDTVPKEFKPTIKGGYMVSPATYRRVGDTVYVEMTVPVDT